MYDVASGVQSEVAPTKSKYEMKSVLVLNIVILTGVYLDLNKRDDALTHSLRTLKARPSGCQKLKMIYTSRTIPTSVPRMSTSHLDEGSAVGGGRR